MIPEEHAIGIDLGTTYSCVAVWRHERAEIIANDQGNRTTPSIVAFSGQERLIGDSALNQAAKNSANTIYGVKRMIGRHFSDTELQKDMEYWPFKVINSEGNPVVEVEYMGEIKTFTPVEISAMILAKLKQSAELKLGPVKKAVITVPAYFNNAQRQSTLDAGKIAGLEVLRVFTEPTAAALAYGFDVEKSAASTILVYDLGGGTFDVSLLKIEERKFVVKATSGDSHLGGEDFDNALVDHCIKVFKKKHGIDLSNNTKAVRRLKTNCEKAKRALSSAALVHVEVDSLYDGIDFSLPLTRAKFESLCQPQFDLSIKAVKAILADAKIRAVDVDEVVLSGGSSRIPKIQQMLSEFFGGRSVNNAIHLDEAVASGAAIQAALLAGKMKSEMNQLVLVDVTPLSLGIRLVGDKMSIVIERNSVLPVTRTETFTTVEDYQTHILKSVYEGESASTKNNILLGEFTIENIQYDKAGVPKIEVTFELDFDGILTVTARDRVTQSTSNIVITGYKGRFSKDQIDGMVEAAKRLDAQDRLALESQLAKLNLEVEYRGPPKHTNYTQASKFKGFFKKVWSQALSWAGDPYDSNY